MKRQSQAARSRAARLRKRIRDGERVSAKDKRWLDAYEQETARWRGSSDEDDDDQDDDVAELEDEPALGSVKPPVHFAEPREGDAARWTAEPHLPPAASSPSSEPEPQPGAPPLDPAANAAAAAAVDPNAPRPIVDKTPPPPLDPTLLAAGAQRFAGMVAGFNAFGLAALLEMIPPGTLPLPEGLEETIRDPKNHEQLIGFIAANAYELALRHPWLCSVAPSPAVIVLGATSISGGALYLRYLRPMLSGEKREQPVEVGPDAAAKKNGANGHARPAPAPSSPPPTSRGFDVEDLGFPS